MSDDYDDDNGDDSWSGDDDTDSYNMIFCLQDCRCDAYGVVGGDLDCDDTSGQCR